MQINSPDTRRAPIAVLGSGALVSHLFREDGSGDSRTYQFNLFRLTSGLSAVHVFGPDDLRQIVKTCQVIAFAIMDDGWVSSQRREELQKLFTELDELTSRWSVTNAV